MGNEEQRAEGKELRAKSKVFLLIGIGVFIALFMLPGAAYPQTTAPASKGFDPDKIISYDDRLRFYLDLKTKDFLVEMADKEMVLLQTIENITAEVRQRGIDGLINDDAGFNLVYQKAQTLAENYTAELEAILAMIDEISALSKTLAQERQYDLLDKFQNLKSRLVAAIENRNLYKKASATTGHKTGLLKEYNVEVDSLLRIYNRLEKFGRLAVAKGDTAVLPLVEKQKASLLSMVAELESPDFPSTASNENRGTPDLAETFLKETEQIAILLVEMEKLEKATANSLETTIEVETVRRNLVAKMDTRVLQLFGFEKYASLRRPTLEEIFHAWRGERLADYEARSTEYAVMKKRLLETGNPKARGRMLERDLTNSLLNYAAERYALAELQFDAIIRDYDRYFSSWDAIKFYRAESFYARAIYPSAFESYAELLRSYPASKFRGLALLRLMTIAHALKWEKAFFVYYHRLDSSASLSEEQKRKSGATTLDTRLVERARYVAGYYNLILQKYPDAETALSLIPPSSRYHYAAQYLRGIVQTNLDNLSSATMHFQYIADAGAGMKEPIVGLALADPATTLIYNNALMRLGYIYYQRGEVETAIRYFEKVSRGVENYDQALIGLSWSYLKKGDLDKTIATTGSVLGNYLSSNYQYEAMVLAAHCRRLLDQPENALEDFRYVTNAHGVLEMAGEYNAERAQILAQLGEVDRMEKAALEHQDKQLYGIIAEVRQTLVGMMNNFGYRSNNGAMMVEEFSEERRNIYRQIQQLDRVIKEANAMGLIDVAREAVDRRNRLVQVLETYQADRSIENVNYFIDYPLATKESGAAYRRQVVLNLFKEMAAEQERLKENLTTANRLITARGAATVNVALDLKAVQEDFKNLKYRMDRFQTWLSTYNIDEVTTNADHWADLSGFGMSDIAFQQINQREQRIGLYSQNLASIDNILRDRKGTLEDMLRTFDKEMRQIEESLINEQVRLDKLEHETYFKTSYFDKATSEVDAGAAPKQPAVEDILKEQIP